MALTDRVRKLERRSGMESLCAVCHGHGWQRSSLVMNGVELEPVRPVGCPGCGRGEINHVMVVDVPGDEWANERFVITRIFGCKDPDEADTAAGMARWTARGNAAGGQP